MCTRVWDRAREGVSAYRRRSPERTGLYRIVYQERDNLAREWEERYQSEYGCLRGEVLETLDGYLNCGILAHGASRAVCESCKRSIVIAFSCKKRGVCPSCAAKRALIFAEHLHSEVLQSVPHHHAVFSLPKRLRAYFRYDRKLAGILFCAAWESIGELLQAVVPEGAPGTVLVFQSAGESLNFNPHIHGIVSGGVFDGAGRFHEIRLMSSEKLEKLFTHKVLSALKRRELIDDAVISQILSQAHTGFSAWWGEAITPTDESYRLFLSRYIDRGPVAESRIEIQDDLVTYVTEKDPITHEFSAIDFLARLTPHIPKKWESTTRYFGWYSHRGRGERKKKNIPDFVDSVFEPLDKRKASKTWAALIKKVFELDPLICEKCGGTMKIKSFITDPYEVARLLKNLGIPAFTTPMPVRATGPPESYTERCFEDLPTDETF